MVLFYRWTGNIGDPDSFSSIQRFVFDRGEVSRETVEDFCLYLDNTCRRDGPSLETRLDNDSFTMVEREMKLQVIMYETELGRNRFYNYRSWLRYSGVLETDSKMIDSLRNERRVMRFIGFYVDSGEKPVVAIRNAVSIVYGNDGKAKFDRWYREDVKRRSRKQVSKLPQILMSILPNELTHFHYRHVHDSRNLQLVNFFRTRRRNFIFDMFVDRYVKDHGDDLKRTFPLSLYFRLANSEPEALVRRVLNQHRRKIFETDRSSNLGHCEGLAFEVITIGVGNFANSLLAPFSTAFVEVDYPLGIKRLRERYMGDSGLVSMAVLGRKCGVDGRYAIHLTEKKTLALLREHPAIKRIIS